MCPSVRMKATQFVPDQDRFGWTICLILCAHVFVDNHAGINGSTNVCSLRSCVGKFEEQIWTFLSNVCPSVEFLLIGKNNCKFHVTFTR